MSDEGQAYCMLKEFIRSRSATPWVAAWFMSLTERDSCWMGPRMCLQRLGGLAGEW